MKLTTLTSTDVQKADQNPATCIPGRIHATNATMPTGEYRAWAFDNLSTVPYGEEDWMSQNAGSGEKVTVTSAGSTSVTLKRITAPAE